MTTYSDRQRDQMRRFMTWVKVEGGVEGPTHLSTLLSPHQRVRMDWLKINVTGRILEAGSNYGFVLAWVDGHVGVDISPMNVELAKLLNPTKEFHFGNVVALPFDDKSFDSVLLPETLEHLDWPNGVQAAIQEGHRVARKRVLITMPDGREDTVDATNFKHLWLLDEIRAKELLSWMPGATLEYLEGFALIRWEVGV